MRNSMTHQAAEALERGLATAETLGASAAKLRFSQRESIGSRFENGRLKEADSRQTISYGVEVLAGGKKGSAAGNDLADLDEIIARAVSLARTGSAAHFQAYPAAGRTRAVKTHSTAALGLTREKMIAGCQRIVDALKDYDAELYIEAGTDRSESERLLMTSGGVRHRSSGTHWSLGSYAQRTEGTDMLFAGFYRGWRDVNEFYDPDVIIEHILADLRNGERIVEPPRGAAKAFLPPETLAMFLWPVGLGINGRNVAKGDSPLRGRLGQQVLDPCLTILDDPHLDYCNGAAEIDGDGVPTRPMSIFKAGVLENFLYDLDSAGLAGAEPTGNDGCSPHSVDVQPGRKSSEELLAGIDDGICIKQLIGFGQSNVMNGDFSANVGLGYRIRGGKIVGRVKNTMVAGNVYELLKQGVQLSSDRDEMYRMPYAVLDGIHVSG